MPKVKTPRKNSIREMKSTMNYFIDPSDSEAMRWVKQLSRLLHKKIPITYMTAMKCWQLNNYSEAMFRVNSLIQKDLVEIIYDTKPTQFKLIYRERGIL